MECTGPPRSVPMSGPSRRPCRGSGRRLRTSRSPSGRRQGPRRGRRPARPRRSTVCRRRCAASPGSYISPPGALRRLDAWLDGPSTRRTGGWPPTSPPSTSPAVSPRAVLPGPASPASRSPGLGDRYSRGDATCSSPAGRTAAGRIRDPLLGRISGGYVNCDLGDHGSRGPTGGRGRLGEWGLEDAPPPSAIAAWSTPSSVPDHAGPPARAPASTASKVWVSEAGQGRRTGPRRRPRHLPPAAPARPRPTVRGGRRRARPPRRGRPALRADVADAADVDGISRGRRDPAAEPRWDSVNLWRLFHCRPGPAAACAGGAVTHLLYQACRRAQRTPRTRPSPAGRHQ